MLAPLAFLLLVLPPGLLLRRASGVDRLGLSGAVALGFGAQSLTAFALGLVGAPLLVAGAVLVGVALASATILVRRGHRPRLTPPGAADLSVAAAALAVGVVAAWEGPWLSHTADTFYHLAAIRSLLLKGEAFPTLPLYGGAGSWSDPTSSGLHTLAALAAWSTRADAVDAWKTLHPAAAALAAAALVRFGWVASGVVVGGLAALGLHLVAFGGMDLRSAAYPNQVGMALFWTALAVALRRGPSAPALAGLGAVHVGLAAASLIPIGLIGVLGRDRRALVGLATGLAVVALRSGPLGIGTATVDARIGTPAYPAMAPSLVTPLTGPLFGALAGAWPTLLAPAVLGTLAALAVMAVGAKVGGSRATAAIGLAGTVPLLVVLSSWAPLPASSGYALLRVSIPLGALLPVALACVLVLPGVRRPWRFGVAALVAWAALNAGWNDAVRLLAPATPDSHSLASSRAADLGTAWADRIAAVRSLPAGTTILAGSDTAFALAGLAGVYAWATPLSHTPAAIERRDGWLRRGDAHDLLALTAPPERIASVAEASGGYVLVDDGVPTWRRWVERPPSIFRRIAAGRDWALFRYDPQQLGAYLALPALGDGTWGLLPESPLAGERAFVRGPPGAQGRVALVHAGSGATAGEAELTGGVTPLAVRGDAPVGWYRLVVRAPDGAVTEVATVAVGHEYELESFPAPSVGPAHQWALYGQSFFSRGATGRTNAPAAIARPVPPLPPGRYVGLFRVYEDERGGLNQVELRLGGTTTGAMWGAGAGAPRWVSNPFETRETATRVELTATRVGQNWVMVDALRIYPLR